eukprot:gene8493-317_t
MSNKTFTYNLNAQEFSPQQFLDQLENADDLEEQLYHDEGEFYYGDSFEGIPQGAFVRDDFDIHSGAVMFDVPDTKIFNKEDEENMNLFLSTKKIEKNLNNIDKIQSLLSEKNMKTENLQKIRKEVLSCTVKNDENVSEIVNEILSICLSKNKSIYSDLCCELIKYSQNDEWFSKFRMLFLKRFQTVYESTLELFENDKNKYKIKMQKLLNFVGELWSRNILGDQILISIVNSNIKEIDVIFPFFTKFGTKLLQKLEKQTDEFFDVLDSIAIEKTTIEGL